jgi:hypothetical protein
MKIELMSEGEELIQSLLDFDMESGHATEVMEKLRVTPLNSDCAIDTETCGSENCDLYTNGNFYINFNKIIQELCTNPATKALSSMLDQILNSGILFDQVVRSDDLIKKEPTIMTHAKIETIVAEADKCPRMSNKKRLFQFKLDSEKRLVRKRRH